MEGVILVVESATLDGVFRVCDGARRPGYHLFAVPSCSDFVLLPSCCMKCGFVLRRVKSYSTLHARVQPTFAVNCKLLPVRFVNWPGIDEQAWFKAAQNNNNSLGPGFNLTMYLKLGPSALPLWLAAESDAGTASHMSWSVCSADCALLYR
jgi:hypothetical protein